MSDFVNRDTLSLIRSGNDPDYPDPPWLLIPRVVLEAAEAIPQQYRKLAGDLLGEMTQAEKDAVDAAEAAAAVIADKAASKTTVDDRRWKALIVLLVTELNRLRQNPTTVYPAYTADQVRTALRNAIDTVT